MKGLLGDLLADALRRRLVRVQPLSCLPVRLRAILQWHFSLRWQHGIHHPRLRQHSNVIMVFFVQHLLDVAGRSIMVDTQDLVIILALG